MADTDSYLYLAPPAPTLVSGSDGIAVTAPVISLASGGLGAIVSAPAPTLSAIGYGGVDITIRALAPAPRVAASGTCGIAIAVSGSAPTPTLSIGTKDVYATAPKPTLIAAVATGVMVTATPRAPAGALAAILVNPAIITVAGSAPPIQIATALNAGAIATARLAVRAPRFVISGVRGNTATSILTAATPIMAIAGYPAYTITFGGTAPAPYTFAALDAALAASYRTWVLNTRKGALTEYDFTFNSYAVFNGKVIAAGATGVVELGVQDTDATAAIDATITTGEDSFGTSAHKRVPRIYLGHSAAGEMRFSTTTVEGGTRTYALPWNGISGTQQRRIPVGKGPKSRFWAFSVSNVDGADFTISDMLVYPVKLRRRVM